MNVEKESDGFVTKVSSHHRTTNKSPHEEDNSSKSAAPNRWHVYPIWVVMVSSVSAEEIDRTTAYVLASTNIGGIINKGRTSSHPI